MEDDFATDRKEAESVKAEVREHTQDWQTKLRNWYPRHPQLHAFLTPNLSSIEITFSKDRNIIHIINELLNNSIAHLVIYTGEKDSIQISELEDLSNEKALAEALKPKLRRKASIFLDACFTEN